MVLSSAVAQDTEYDWEPGATAEAMGAVTPNDVAFDVPTVNHPHDRVHIPFCTHQLETGMDGLTENPVIPVGVQLTV